MAARPLQLDHRERLVLPQRLQSLLTMTALWREYSALLVRSDFGCEQEREPESAAAQIQESGGNQSSGNRSGGHQSGGGDEFSALNTLIHDLGGRWAQKARATQFDFQFRAVEQERRRVAKELHDEILPSLARLIRSIQSDSEQALVDELHTTVGAFRDLLGELHPFDLEELGLIPALSNICQRYASLTGRFIGFIEHAENCRLTEVPQLCLYRALQIALRMFSQSENDILIVTYHHVANNDVITVRCIDKLVSSQEWLSAGKQDFSTFETWCSIAGAKVEYGTNYGADFPYDLVITIPENGPEQTQTSKRLSNLTQVRLAELDNILAQAIEEWTNLIQRDRTLFENLAVEAERKRISDEINSLILPHLQRITDLAIQSKDELLIQNVSERMQVIEAGVNAVMSELHPRLLAQAGLFSSIRTLVDRFRRASLVETTIISNPECDQVDISLAAKFAIYRVTQEALNNIEKHSNATHALVVVKQIAEELIVCIEDNGKGFQGSSNTLSRGLKNIRERASEIGARVAWENSSSFETGTLVTISLRC